MGVKTGMNRQLHHKLLQGYFLQKTVNRKALRANLSDILLQIAHNLYGLEQCQLD